MDFEDVIKKRKMVRKFRQDKPISDKIISKLIRNAHRAPSAQINERTKRHAFKMMNEMLRRKTANAGKDPMGLAASILYIACKETGEVKTQKNMANAAGVTEETIRNRVRDLGTSLNLPSALW